MVYIRQIRFEGAPPSIPIIIERVYQLTGIQANYLASKWLLTNPDDTNDVFSLYQEGENSLLLLDEGKETVLLRATIETLFDLGGYYDDWPEGTVNPMQTDK